MKELENKVALVSSSTRGIGLACAKTLAAQGAAVYLGVRRLEAGQQIADELIAAGGRAGVVFFDASREESFSGMVDEVAAKEGRLDILVNNFGSTDVKTDLDVVNGPSEDFFRIVNTNLKSVYLPSKAAVPPHGQKRRRLHHQHRLRGRPLPRSEPHGLWRQQGGHPLPHQGHRRAVCPAGGAVQRGAPRLHRHRRRSEQHVPGLPGALP